MYSHATKCVPSYYYILCPHTTIYVVGCGSKLTATVYILYAIHTTTYAFSCCHTTIYVSSQYNVYYYMFVHVSSYYYMCPHTTISVSS